MVNTHGPLAVAVDATSWEDFMVGITQHVATIIPSACCCRYQDNEDKMVSFINTRGPLAVAVDVTSWQWEALYSITAIIYLFLLLHV